MKKHIVIATLLVSALTGLGRAQADASSINQRAPHYSHAELKQLIANAHTSSDYQTLASYYHLQQQSFQMQAEEEKREWERLSQNVSGPYAKYPRPVDSAHSLYQYYSAKANQMAALETHYQQLAAPDPSNTVK